MPLGSFSVGISRLVSPISSRAASPLKERMVASWLFQPKRPTRVVVGSSSNGTMFARPLTPGPLDSKAKRSASAMASTKP